MSKPKFYQAVLTELQPDNLKEILRGQSMTARMGSEEARCPDCGENSWWLLPKQGAAVRQGGKPYCECMNCGYTTHL